MLECTEIYSDFAEARKADPTVTAPACCFGVGSKKLYDLYRFWTKENGEPPRNNVTFKNEMIREGFTYKRSGVGITVYGLNVRVDKEKIVE